MITAPEASPEVRDAWRAGYAAAVKHARDGLEMARRRCHEPPAAARPGRAGPLRRHEFPLRTLRHD